MRVSEALALFHHAEEAGSDPDACAAGRWTCHMLTGNFEQAWQESDSITRRGNPDPNRYWDGRPLDGQRVLIRCLHGLGDTIQFVRYAPLLRERACSVVIEAQPCLRDLLNFSGLADSVFTWGEPEPAWDRQIEIVELPRIFRTAVDAIPDGVPYLHAPFEFAAATNGKAHAPRVGIVWSSSNYNPLRSIPAHLIARLVGLPHIKFFSLQAGPERFDLERLQTHVPSLYRDNHTVLSTAKIVRSLDLVITVDTMMAHLAGSMAIPVWTLLPYQCDWRWMLERTSSPWYPTMRLFRQRTPDGWDEVLREVEQELLEFTTSHIDADSSITESFD